MSAMANKMAGKAMSPSITRITTMSRRREKPATRPTAMPPTEVSTIVVTPTRSEMRLPWRTRPQAAPPNPGGPGEVRGAGGLAPRRRLEPRGIVRREHPRQQRRQHEGQEDERAGDHAGVGRPRVNQALP